MKINRRIRLSDLQPISQQEFDTARHICEKIRKIVESRTSYIEKHKLDPDITLPDANWAEDAQNNLYNAYRLVVTPKYDVINRLRFYTQPFTGSELMLFPMPCGKRSVNYIPAENIIPKEVVSDISAYLKMARIKLIPNGFDEKIQEPVPVPDEWVHRYIAITRCVPSEIIARPPKILGEIGWNVDGSPVNRDTYVYQERLNLLYEAGIIDWLRKKAETSVASGGLNILEIGAGCGGLAYYLKHIIPQANYIICDLPESLLFSSLYLAIACPEYRNIIYDGTDKSILYESGFGFKFIPNFMFDDLAAADIRIDLAINTLSFSEMSEKQVRYYAENLSYMLSDRGILFEQNHDSRPMSPICCKLYLSEYLKFRKTIGPKSVPELTQGVADVWANKRIPDILRPTVKTWILLIRCLRSRRWLLYKIRHIVRAPQRFALKCTLSLVRRKRCATLKEFVESMPRLKSFVFRILGVTR